VPSVTDPIDLRPFRIAIDQQVLDDLHDRLDRTRWPEELPDAGWDYGVPLDELRRLADYWRHDYDWREAEARLNAWPQFETTIDGANVHLAHIRSPEPNAVPLLMVHGWPGSLVEFSAVIGPLTDPAAHGGDAADAFHLVLPTIPGFTLSGPTRDRGWEVGRTAAAFAELMTRLSYPRFGTQGGDWGAAITREMGRELPDRVVGVHLNLLPGAQANEEPTAAVLAELSPAEAERTRKSWQRSQDWAQEREGYAVLQASRPQTLAYALTDSPVGQLAWIAEKFHDWTDPASDIDTDTLLTNVMLYWVSATAGSSARIYYERAHSDTTADQLSTAPTALASFAHDNFIPLRHVAERSNRMVRWTEYPCGGHFQPSKPRICSSRISAPSFVRSHRSPDLHPSRPALKMGVFASSATPAT
jgi:pimeloyl-ACP methyl ester carboxylesterase